MATQWKSTICTTVSVQASTTSSASGGSLVSDRTIFPSAFSASFLLKYIMPDTAVAIGSRCVCTRTTFSADSAGCKDPGEAVVMPRRPPAAAAAASASSTPVSAMHSGDHARKPALGHFLILFFDE